MKAMGLEEHLERLRGLSRLSRPAAHAITFKVRFPMRKIGVLLLMSSIALVLAACGQSVTTESAAARATSTHIPVPTLVPAPPSGIKVYVENSQADVIYESQLRSPEGIAFGPNGDLYIADWLGYRVMRLSENGELSVAVQIPRRRAGSSGPRDVAFDAEGSMFVVTPSEILRVTQEGNVEPIVTDLCCMSKIEFGPDGNLYFANERTNDVRLMEPDGTMELVVSGLDRPFDVAFSPVGEMYVSEFDGDILRVDAGGEAAYFAKADPGSFDPFHMAFDRAGNLCVHGNGTLDIFDSLGNRVDPGIDGHVLGFPGASPGGIAFDGHGNLYVADSPGAKILLIDPDHHVEVVVRGFNPTGIALGPDGDIYAASSVDFPLRPGEVWRISPDGEPEVVAQFESEGAQAIAVDTGGNVFVSLINLNGSRVVRLSPDGAIENFATGPYDFGTIAADGSGGLYVSIPNSGEIYRAEGDGSLSPFARGLSRGEVHCFTLAVSPEGVLYAADSNTGDILRFSRDGDYVVVAHLSDLTGFPNALSVGPAGTLFVQTGGVPLYLYRVLPTGAYEVVASDVWGDPAGLAFDGQRNLYISRGGTVDRLQGLIVP